MKLYISLIFLFLTSAVAAQTTEEHLTDGSGKLIAKLIYKNAHLRVRCLYQYDEEGRCYQTIVDNGPEDPESLEGCTERLITTMVPMQKGELLIIKKHFDCITGHETLIKEAVLTFGPDSKLLKQSVLDADGILTETFYDDQPATVMQNRSSLNDWFDQIYSFFFKQNIETHLWERITASFEHIAEFLIGPTMFSFSGYDNYQTNYGVYGQREMNDKVRITLVNGILNHPADHLQHLDTFSQLHGGNNIHYIFRAFEGWSKDMFKSIASKFGFLSSQAELLAQTWRDMIAEMGGIEGGGTIIHYAHSIGGSETKNAKTLMTPEELKMIRVYAIATPTLLSNDGFQYVINYVSKRDGVCYLDPIDYFMNLDNPDSNIVYLSTFWGIPMIDHLLMGDTYRPVIEQLAAEFVSTYGQEEKRGSMDGMDIVPFKHP